MFRLAYGRDGFSFFTGEQNRGRSRKGYAQSARYLTEKSKTNKISKVTKLKSPGKNHSGKWIPGRQLGMAEDPAGSNSGAGDRCREGTGRTECDASVFRAGDGKSGILPAGYPGGRGNLYLFRLYQDEPGSHGTGALSVTIACGTGRWGKIVCQRTGLL